MKAKAGVEPQNESGRRGGLVFPLDVDPLDSPKTQKKQAEIKPALRAANHRVMRAAKKALVAWRHAYRCAFEAFRAGVRDVVWPAGTWFYAKYAGVVVAEAGSAFGFGVG